VAKPERRWWSSHPVIARYGVAVVSVTVALFSSRLLDLYLVGAPVSLFLCAVIFSAWFGGIRPGLLATVLSILAFKYNFTAPVYSLFVDIKEIPRLLIFALSAFFVCLLSAAQRRATEALRHARDKLAGTVQELERINKALHTENAERNRAQKALRESEERLQDIIDNTTAVVFVKDLDLRYLLVNREYERRYRVRRDQICGKTDFDIHPYAVAEVVRGNDRQVIEAGAPIQFEETVPSEEGERDYIVSRFLLHDHSNKPCAVGGVATDITESKRAQRMQAALARERELFAQQRATELAKASTALRECLDALASVPELDEFLGQVTAAITRQLGAISSTLRVRNFKRNTLPLEFVFQDGRVMTPDEAEYPERWQSVSLEQFDPDLLCHSALARAKDERPAATFLNPPAAVIRVLDPRSPMPDDQRSYLRQLGVKTVLIIPLTSRGQANGRLTFRFTEERDFHPEELEIARALATQASLSIHLTRLAKSASQSAVLEERNQLAAEIHDALAQSFSAISMQLGVAGEQLAAKQGDPLNQIQRANEIAKFGLAEARRSILSLGSIAMEESGLTTTLQRLVEHSNVAGRVRCDFRSDNIPEESLPPRIQHELLRFAQEAISNAVRHAKATVVSVTLRWESPNLILQVKDNGSGISKASLEKSEGFGLRNMRTRASQIDGKLDITTAAGHGTSIVLTTTVY
jgi:two-component system, NarL family, sensor kinase